MICYKIPQVLLLGNGLNLAYGGISWSKLIESIAKRNDFIWSESKIPMPLQAILATDDHIKTALEEHNDLFRGALQTEDQKYILQVLLTTGFDDILTTNYSYELEEAAIGKNELSDSQIKKLMHYTSQSWERNYLLHTYNQVACGNVKNRIWHIHGEIRKTESMILGHYWYGNLLKRIIDENKKRSDIYIRNQRAGKENRLDSWIDSFILGDVYILGYGFDLSEIDLWWLLNRKQRETANHGKVYFYEINSTVKREKTALLELMGAEIINLGFSENTSSIPDYRSFYQSAIDDIQEKIHKKG